MQINQDDNKIGSFKIIEKIGEGGMAIIYKAVQPALNRTVVVKKLKDPNREIIERFKKEALVSASFSQENVLSIYDFIYSGRSYYLVMEYVDGRDLRTIIDYTAPLPPFIAALIIREVAKGLEYTHTKNIIHRDIKPSNILISYQGDVKLIDFGIAKDQAPSKLTVTGMIVGTPSYMSPEQANGDQIGKESDIYSLGVLLFEMVTGVKPFVGGTNTEVLMKIVKGKFSSPKKYNRDLPWGLIRIIKKSMQKDTSKRYKYSSEMIRDLDRFIPWQEQTNKKEILSLFLRNFDSGGQQSSETKLRSASMLAGNHKSFGIATIVIVLLFIFSLFQLNRFLQIERLAKLEITTNVSNSTVFLDDVPIGKIEGARGIFSNIKSGNHVLKIKGFNDIGIYMGNLNLSPGKKHTVNALIPKRNTHVTITANSQPQGARIYIDNTFYGITPINSFRLESGFHKIKITKNGFQNYIDEFYLDKNQSYNLFYQLEETNSSNH